MTSGRCGHIAGKSDHIPATAFDRILSDRPLNSLDRFHVRGAINQCDAEPVIDHNRGLHITKAGDLLQLASQGEGVIECRCVVREMPSPASRTPPQPPTPAQRNPQIPVSRGPHSAGSFFNHRPRLADLRSRNRRSRLWIRGRPPLDRSAEESLPNTTHSLES
jgi:hypothetical protein